MLIHTQVPLTILRIGMLISSVLVGVAGSLSMIRESIGALFNTKIVGIVKLFSEGKI